MDGTEADFVLCKSFYYMAAGRPQIVLKCALSVRDHSGFGPDHSGFSIFFLLFRPVDTFENA